MIYLVVLFATLVQSFTVTQDRISQARDAGAHNLAALWTRVVENEAEVAKEMSMAFPTAPVLESVEAGEPDTAALPIVVTHGMGDSCFNAGMKSITAAAGTHMGVYSVCVPGGKNEITDTISGFLTTMDKNVDIFAEKVRADPKLAGGFDAFGLSQGNSVLRGYITRYNDPPVRNYLSVHGTVMGVGGFPNCNPVGILPGICDTIAEALGTLAYSKLIQDSLFQANYFRDPERLNTTQYQENSQIAQWNNENPKSVNSTYKDNFMKVQSYSMIKAKKDTMVYPNEGEWWGFFEPGSFKVTQTMKQTDLYQQDSFGLKSVDSEGRIRFNETDGNHLQFTVEQLTWWLDEYFK